MKIKNPKAIESKKGLKDLQNRTSQMLIALNILGQSWRDISERTGTGTNQVKAFADIKATPTTRFIRTFCKEYNVSPTWLFFGIGEKDLFQ